MIELFEGADGWRYRVVATNEEVLATSEAYSSKSNAKRGVEDFARAVTSQQVEFDAADDNGRTGTLLMPGCDIHYRVQA